MSDEALKMPPTGEKEMRAYEVKWPRSIEELVELVNSVVERQHDYGTCVYAMSIAATAAFNYVAGRLGVTGFQSSFADMDVLRRTRSMKGPFCIVDISNALYPQYDLVGDLQQYIAKNRDWLRDEAKKMLAERGTASPSVVEHWKELAKP